MTSTNSFFYRVLGTICLFLLATPCVMGQYSSTQGDPCSPDLFGKRSDSIPVVIANLGASPQFDRLREITDNSEFFDALKSYTQESAGKYGYTSARERSKLEADRAKLDDLLKCLGYEDGILDKNLSEASFTRKRFFKGVRGILGNDNHEYHYSVILNNRKDGIIDAWNIASKNDKSLYILSTCGNAFVHTPDSGRVCIDCPEKQEVALKGSGRLGFQESRTLTKEVSIPVRAEEGCCRGTRDSSLVDIGVASFSYQATAETYLDTIIHSTLSYQQLDSCFDYKLVQIDDTTYYGLKPQLTLTSTESVEDGLVLPGYRFLAYNDNILRVSIGTEFAESIKSESRPNPFILNRETEFRPMFSIAVGIEKYLDNCFYIAIDGMYANKKIRDTYSAFQTEVGRFGIIDTISQATVSVDIPSPLHYLGLSTTLLYELKRCGKGLKVGIGPHIYHGISSNTNASNYISDIPDIVRDLQDFNSSNPNFISDNPDPETDFSYGAIGLHAEAALLITDRIEIFGQAGFNNHRYQNFGITQFEGRIGAKYAFSKKEEFRKMKKKARRTSDPVYTQ